jgi:hypothetical protein
MPRRRAAPLFLTGDNTMTDNRALAVIRRVADTSNFYEAWLHHRTTIRSTHVGVRSTKDWLQVAANMADDFPSQPVMAQDIESALATNGDEVMVFYVHKGGRIDVPEGLFYTDEGLVVTPIEYPLEVRPPPTPLVHVPPIPLTPLLEPLYVLSDARLQALSALDFEHRKMVAAALATGIDVGDVAKVRRGADVAVAYPTQFKKVGAEFAAMCNVTRRVLRDSTEE